MGAALRTQANDLLGAVDMLAFTRTTADVDPPARRRGDRITMRIAAVHESAVGRLCCKSPKLPGDKFPATRRTNRRRRSVWPPIALPKSPMNSSLGDEVPHIFTRKSRLQTGEFLTAVSAQSGHWGWLRGLGDWGDDPEGTQCLRQRSSSTAPTGSGVVASRADEDRRRAQ